MTTDITFRRLAIAAILYATLRHEADEVELARLESKLSDAAMAHGAVKPDRGFVRSRIERALSPYRMDRDDVLVATLVDSICSGGM